VHGKPRIKLPLTEEAPLSTTKSDGMWKIKVLFMSGYASDAIGDHGVLDPDTAFLQKPFTPDILIGKVREMLDMP
jgi:hypothetical protein